MYFIFLIEIKFLFKNPISRIFRKIIVKKIFIIKILFNTLNFLFILFFSIYAIKTNVSTFINKILLRYFMS